MSGLTGAVLIPQQICEMQKRKLVRASVLKDAINARNNRQLKLSNLNGRGKATDPIEQRWQLS
jgi:hypothetical protein